MSFDAGQSVRQYLADCWQARQYGNPTERTYYPALQTLLNAVGATLKPKVFGMVESAGAARAGNPDFGLFTAAAARRAAPDEPGPLAVPPDRGVVEVKLPRLALDRLVASDQVRDYWQRHGIVLATNLRAFRIVGSDPVGRGPIAQELFELADSEEAFWALCRRPSDLPEERARACAEFLWRAQQARATLSQPKDVAAVLASYARQALVRLEAIPSIGRPEDLDALDAVRRSLESGLGISFEGEKGEHFFRSTLVQTVFYGLFSAWVMWRRRNPDPATRTPFSFEAAVWLQRLPVIQDLVAELINPSAVMRLGLREILQWAAEALARVDEARFFERFRQDQAVQYFYEPFLEAYDPELRRQLGVWYTPHEVVDYMVERVDRTLREELGCPDGLAEPRVVVLDPCCGTGSYLVAVLRRIARTLAERGEDALVAQQVKRAAVERIVGFEIMPAPFVVAHLQVELLMQDLGAPLAEAGSHRPRAERAKVLLTNALTGWDAAQDPPGYLPLPHFQNEVDAARRVKRDDDILVVIGNPPYYSYADVRSEEEAGLVDPYRRARRAPDPEGRGLNDLYVRFFRIAERRIAEMSGRGVVCFISNYSWLNGSSYTGMREAMLGKFDSIRIDCLNGDKYKTGKVTPDGRPDPSIFSTQHNREGIQVGTAIASLTRLAGAAEERGDGTVRYRDFWGTGKWAALAALAQDLTDADYRTLAPDPASGLRFAPTAVHPQYFEWPRIVDIVPDSFPGIFTARDVLLTDIDADALRARINRYFDPSVTFAEIQRECPGGFVKTQRYDPERVRTILAARGIRPEGFIEIEYRPFDRRHLYWESETKLLDEKRTAYVAQLFPSNVWMIASERLRRESVRPQFVRSAASLHLMERGTSCFPLLLDEHPPQDAVPTQDPAHTRPNLSRAAARYLASLGVDPNFCPDGGHHFFHLFAVMHAAAYEDENADALREGWPRIPLPASGARLEASAELGRRVAALLDSATPVEGVTAGAVRPELRVVAPLRVRRPEGSEGRGDAAEAGPDFRVRARWGYRQKSGAVFPGPGDARPRAYTETERAAILEGAAALGLSGEAALACLGAGCLDVHLNDDVWLAGVPERVWRYTVGGYQVLKKWLSYREHALLGRPLHDTEIAHLRDTARRLAALLLLEPELDANYRAVLADTYEWPRDEGAA